MPYKRAASEKSGLPVYQPTGVQQQQQQQQQQQLQQQQAAYHQILQIQQQPSIVPGTATCEYTVLHQLSLLLSLKSKVQSLIKIKWTVEHQSVGPLLTEPQP